VRQHGAAAIQQGSEVQQIGATWWYVLQAHHKMDEFLEIGFKQHPVIIPVFTAHLDRHRVSKTTFATLETPAKRIKTDMTVLQTSVQHLNGACGKPTCRANAAGDEVKVPV
jgi:hypothetical protein